MDILGKPYIRVKKDKFMYGLSRSLLLSRDIKENYYKESNILFWMKEYLNKSRNYHFGESDNLLLNQFLDLNYVQLAHFGHLKPKSKAKFFYKLLKLADYSEVTRDYLLNLAINAAALADTEITTAVPTSINNAESLEEGTHTKRSGESSLTEFSNDEIRILYRNPTLRNTPFDADTMRNKRNISPYVDLAIRWKTFASNYKKIWKTRRISLEDDTGDEMLIELEQDRPQAGKLEGVEGVDESRNSEMWMEDEEGPPPLNDQPSGNTNKKKKAQKTHIPSGCLPPI